MRDEKTRRIIKIGSFPRAGIQAVSATPVDVGVHHGRAIGAQNPGRAAVYFNVVQLQVYEAEIRGRVPGDRYRKPGHFDVHERYIMGIVALRPESIFWGAGRAAHPKIGEARIVAGIREDAHIVGRGRDDGPIRPGRVVIVRGLIASES